MGQLSYLAGQALVNGPMALVTAAGLVLLALRRQARRGLAVAGCAVLFGATLASVAWSMAYLELIGGGWMGYELAGPVSILASVLLGTLHAVGVGLLLAALLLRPAENLPSRDPFPTVATHGGDG